MFTGQYMTSVVLALPLVFYFNNRNKAFWTGMGQVRVFKGWKLKFFILGASYKQ